MWLCQGLGCYYFDEKRKESKTDNFIEFDETYIEPEMELEYFKIELDDLLKDLSEKERYLVQNHIIEKSLLKQTAIDLDISYVYAKELKRNAIKKLKLLIHL